MTLRSNRVDELGRAYAGSQLQIQIYVNRRREELNNAIRNAIIQLKNYDLEWASPLEGDAFKEYRDGAFLTKVRLEHFESSLADFWPKNGPVWDALAIATPADPSGHPAVILVEGKSYPDEMRTTWDACERSG